MFDFLRRKTAQDFVQQAKDYADQANETYGLPAPKEIPKMPTVPPAPKEKDAVTYYRFGLTDNDRVSFSMGYSEITMNRAGCQQMIDQLTFFMNQLPTNEAEDTDNDE